MTACRAELCPYWPGEGCLRGVVPCPDPPMSEQLAADLREALAESERGETVDLGSFAQYADDDDA